MIVFVKKSLALIKKHRWSVIPWFILLSICLIYSIRFAHNMDFGVTNGSFQNFNPVRRLLNGQIPYDDFIDYLGLGHLYTGTIVTFLMGGNYSASLWAFGFLTILSLGLIFLATGKSIFNNKLLAFSVTNIFIVLLIMQPSIFVNLLSLNKEILNGYNAALTVGNSARFIRGLILPLSAIGMIKLESVFNFSAMLTLRKKYAALAAISLISGIAFIWSTDYGFSCYLCIAIMVFWVILCKHRNVIYAVKITLCEIVMSLSFAFILLEILTLGHATQWIKSIFGTGNFQAWYYNSTKSFYLYNADFSYIMILQATICIAYMVILFKKFKDDHFVRYAIPAYINMTCFCAVNEYQLLSGGGAREVALTVLGATITIEFINYVVKENNFRIKIAIVTSTIWAVAFCGSTLKSEIDYYHQLTKNNNYGFTYFDELGGIMTTLDKDLRSAESFLNGRTVWSTYASALEVITDQYQPSGVDYIIHVLGDEARNDYLSKYSTMSYDFTATIREEYSIFSYWMQNANWFFYRVLYSDSHPVYHNEYELFYERNSPGDSHIITEKINVITEKINETEYKIKVDTYEDVCGYADVWIDYAVSKSNDSDPMLLAMYLYVINSSHNFIQDTSWQNFFLRAKSSEFIPVPVINGYGEVTLLSMPISDTKLTVSDAYCDRILTVPFDYLECTLTEGASVNETELLIQKTERNRIIIDSSYAIIIDGNEYPYTHIYNEDNDYFCLNITLDAELRESIIQQYKTVFPVKKRSKNSVYACSLSDVNWDNGCHRELNCLLFDYSDNLVNKIKSSQYIVNNKKHKIVSYDYDDKWIRVYFSEYPEDCKFPAQLKLE